jgi:hypothetical protein
MAHVGEKVALSLIGGVGLRSLFRNQLQFGDFLKGKLQFAAHIINSLHKLSGLMTVYNATKKMAILFYNFWTRALRRIII